MILVVDAIGRRRFRFAAQITRPEPSSRTIAARAPSGGSRRSWESALGWRATGRCATAGVALTCALAAVACGGTPWAVSLSRCRSTKNKATAAVSARNASGSSGGRRRRLRRTGWRTEGGTVASCPTPETTSSLIGYLATRSGRVISLGVHAQSIGEEPAMLGRRPEEWSLVGVAAAASWVARGGTRHPPLCVRWACERGAGQVPNGHIAFESDIPSGTCCNGIYTVAPNGSGFTQVFTDPSQDLSISEYSPDGRWLLVNRNNAGDCPSSNPLFAVRDNGLTQNDADLILLDDPVQPGDVAGIYCTRDGRGVLIRSTGRGSRFRASTRLTPASTASG